MRSLLNGLIETMVNLVLLSVGSGIAGLLWFAIGLDPVPAAIAGVATFTGLIFVGYMTR